jgi:acetolactate synthase-1/2/3 large subunit
MKMNGSRMVVETMKEENVKTIFGYPGGAIMHVYDEIYKQDYFRHILTRHEQAAVHAADGYARASGDVGVAFVTSGPGFTNAVTGLATAYMDSIPMVVISGQVPKPLVGTDGFQEIDAIGISRPCTKHNFFVNSLEELPRIIKEAFYIARSGRPGPVHIDIPKDITMQEGVYEYPASVSIETYKPTYKGNLKQIKKISQMLKESKKPLLYIGGGAVRSDAIDEIRELAKLTKIPAIETLMARGTMGSNNPLLVGMVGMHGSYASNMAMHETDLLIALGPRFDDRVTGNLTKFAKSAKIIHVDIDPSSIGKIVQPDLPIVGDIKDVLLQLLPILKNDFDGSAYKEWVEKIDEMERKEPLRFSESDTIKPQWAVQRLGELVGDDGIISTDVGQHQMWAAQFYPLNHPRDLITSAGLGTMGFGFPAAMGAKIAHPDRISINISGDGSILMNIQELTTCVEQDIAVINVILNNKYLGMVRQWQEFFYDKRYSETDLSSQPDFVKIAEAFGGIGYRVSTKEEFDSAIKDAIKQNKVALIDVLVEKLENVFPMVPSGGGLNEMMLFKEDKNDARN